MESFIASFLGATLVLVAVAAAFVFILRRVTSGESMTVAVSDWHSGDEAPPEPGAYLVVIQGETMFAELRMMEDEPGYGAWYVIADPEPVRGDEVEAWFGPFELPSVK